MSVILSISLKIYQLIISRHLSIFKTVTCLSTCSLSIFKSIPYFSIYLSICYLSCPSICPPVTCLSICPSVTCQSICTPVTCLSICPSILSISLLPVYLSVNLLLVYLTATCLSICPVSKYVTYQFICPYFAYLSNCNLSYLSVHLLPVRLLNYYLSIFPYHINPSIYVTLCGTVLEALRVGFLCVF